MYKCVYIQYIQGLGQSTLSTADHGLLLVAPATTAVYSLEGSYTWPPPSLSLLYSRSNRFFRVSYKPSAWNTQKHRLYYCNVYSARCVATSMARTTENTASLIVPYSSPRDVFVGPLYSNGCPPMVGCLLVGTCLPSNGVSWLHSLMLWTNLSQKY
jgi:hypothetical protein